MPFVMIGNHILPCRPTQRALDAGDSAAFSSGFLASSFFYSRAESTPTPAPVTQAVRRLLGYSRSLLKKFELQV